MKAHEALDTAPEAAEVQRRAYAAMDGFQRLRVVAEMRMRVVKLLQFRYAEPEEIVMHLFRHRIPRKELDDVIARMRQSQAR